MSTTIADLLVNFRGDIGDLASKIAAAKTDMNTVTETAQSTGGGILSGFKSGISGIVDFGAKIGQTVIGMQGLAQGAVGLASALLEPNASMEQTTVGFETLLGKGKATQDFLSQLKDFAAATPFEFPELATDAQHMLAFGFTAKEVIPTLTNIGDAMGAMGKSSADIDHIVGIFGQMHAAGKLNAGDMMQLADEGIPAWKMLADAMGKTVPEVQKLTTSGLIPADTAIKAVSEGMHKMFGGGMAAQANTFNGLLSTLQDNASAALRAFTGPLFDAAKSGLTQLGNLVSSKQFQDFATSTGQAIAVVFQEIGGFISDNVVPAFQKLQPVVQQFVGYFQSDQFAGIWADFQTLGNQILQIAGAFLQASGPANDLVSGPLSLLPGVLSGILTAADNIIFPLGQFLLWMQQGSPWAEVVKDALIGIGVAFATIQIGSFLATLPAVIAGFIAWGVAAWGAAAGVIAATWPVLAIGAAIAVVVAIIILAVQHWGDIAKWLQGAWSGIATFFTTLFKGIGDKFSQLGSSMQNKATDIKSGIGDKFSDLGTNVRNKTTEMGNAVVNGWKWMYDHNYYFKAIVDEAVKVWEQFKTWAANTWQAISDRVIAIWQNIQRRAHDTWQTVSDAIKTAVTTAVQWLQSIWTTATTWLTTQWNKITSLASSVWAAVSVIFASIWTRYISGPLTSLWNQIQGWFTGIGKGAQQGGQNFISMLANSISSGAGAIWNAVTGIANTIWSALGFHSPPKGGPLADSDKYMPRFINILSTGLTAGAPQVAKASAIVAQQMAYPIRPSATAVASSIAPVMAMQGSAGGQGQTIILEVDGMVLAKINNKNTDKLVRLKLGSKGRVA